MDSNNNTSDPNDHSILNKILKGETDYLSSSSDSDSDDTCKNTRAPKQYNERIDLARKLAEWRQSGKFEERFQMSEPAFENLVKILKRITVDKLQSIRSTSDKAEPMTPTHIVMIGLRYCAGEKIRSLVDI